MTDRHAVALAVLVAIGAAVARGPSPLVGLAVVAIALAARRPWLVCLGAAVLASGLGARSWAAGSISRRTAFRGTVTLVDDPVDALGAVRVDVALDGHRLEAWARGGAASALRPRLAGQHVAVVATIEPIGRRDAYLVRRHIVGRLTVDSVTSWDSGPLLARAANDVHSLVDRAAALLGSRYGPLYAGLVLGDTRGQTPVQSDDFRASGLSHLLAVSGENVAFVLALARPLLARLNLYARLPATLAVLAFFVVLTRSEPSVLRAVFMAGLAALTATLGREASRLRILSLAVAALLLIDPLLVGLAGFQLSVAATAGIVLLAPRIGARLPGPRPLAQAFAVSLAAQVGVAPLLAVTFGGVPVVAVAANVLGPPAAGPVMTWGLSGGLLAGALGGTPGWLLQRPAYMLVGWIAGVARAGAAAPLGQLDLRGVLALCALALVCVAGVRRRLQWLAVCSSLAAFSVAAAPAVALRAPPPLARTPIAGATVWRGADPSAPAVVDLDGTGVDASDLLVALRAEGVRRVGVVVVARPSRAAGAALAAVVERFRPPLVLAPPGWFVPGAQPAEEGLTVHLSGLAVVVTATRPGLAVRVTRPAAAARAPPAVWSRPVYVAARAPPDRLA